MLKKLTQHFLEKRLSFIIPRFKNSDFVTKLVVSDVMHTSDVLRTIRANANSFTSTFVNHDSMRHVGVAGRPVLVFLNANG